MHPSPEPRAVTWSPRLTPAVFSISSVTLSGKVMKGTSSMGWAWDGMNELPGKKSNYIDCEKHRLFEMLRDIPWVSPHGYK